MRQIKIHGQSCTCMIKNGYHEPKSKLSIFFFFFLGYHLGTLKWFSTPSYPHLHFSSCTAPVLPTRDPVIPSSFLLPFALNSTKPSVNSNPFAVLLNFTYAISGHLCPNQYTSCVQVDGLPKPKNKKKMKE